MIAAETAYNKGGRGPAISYGALGKLKLVPEAGPARGSGELEAVCLRSHRFKALIFDFKARG